MGSWESRPKTPPCLQGAQTQNQSTLASILVFTMVANVCERCAEFVPLTPLADPETSVALQPSLDPKPASPSTETGSTFGLAAASGGCCPVCLGAWSDTLERSLLASIREKMATYPSKKNCVTRFSRASRLVILPGDTVYRQRAFARRHNQHSASINDSMTLDFCRQLKLHCQSTLDRCLQTIEDENCTEDTQQSMAAYPPCVEQEEQGYLGVHVILIPQNCYRPPIASKHDKTKEKRKFHKQQPEPSQGGDPKYNLEVRLADQGVDLWTLKHAQAELLGTEQPANDPVELQRLVNTAASPLALDIHVAIWRQPFYLRSMYTKTERDISQTPFHVMEGNKRRRLGQTSVEEVVRPAVTRVCGGISTSNNDNRSNGSTVFGMVKFHASGREDMDVRMLLPKSATPGVTGRPFVWEIYDACALPTVESLRGVVQEINQGDDDLATDGRSYGRNLVGVGIAPTLSFVPAASFKLLQSETESKVKFYGCLCWSQKPLPATSAELNAALGSFPLEIHQATPIRVLHRRANSVRTRQVLQCQAERVDEHHFRLHLSTTAGTYVKEFAHGDLGRTVPSVSTLLDCTTDILELDCEGIQM